MKKIKIFNNRLICITVGLSLEALYTCFFACCKECVCGGGGGGDREAGGGGRSGESFFLVSKKKTPKKFFPPQLPGIDTPIALLFYSVVCLIFFSEIPDAKNTTELRINNHPKHSVRSIIAIDFGCSAQLRILLGP